MRSSVRVLAATPERASVFSSPAGQLPSCITSESPMLIYVRLQSPHVYCCFLPRIAPHKYCHTNFLILLEMSEHDSQPHTAGCREKVNLVCEPHKCFGTFWLNSAPAPRGIDWRSCAYSLSEPMHDHNAREGFATPWLYTREHKLHRSMMFTHAPPLAIRQKLRILLLAREVGFHRSRQAKF